MPRTVEITSPKNPLVQRARDAGAGRIPGEMLVDGRRLVEEALTTDLPMRAAILGARFPDAPEAMALRRRIEERADEIYLCADPVLARMSSLTTPQAVLAILATPNATPRALLGPTPSRALVVAAAGVRDPGNLGAMLRATEAADGTGFIALHGSADPFRDKAVRGSSGSVLRVPTLRGLEPHELMGFAHGHDLQVIVADGHGDTDYLDVDWTKPSCIVLGSEGAGVPDELTEGANVRARIPLRPTVDSLNVAVATGVLLFEVRRQRR